MLSKYKKLLQKNEKLFIISILLVAVILRLISINQSLWLDEAINIIAVRSRSLSDLLFNYSIGDFHPPLYHLFLRIWFKFFGVSEITARLPSVIFAVSTIFLIYKIGKKISKNKKTPAIASLLLATSGLHIYYSQEARMYSLTAFFSTFTFYSLFKLKEKATRKNKLIYLVSLLLMLFSDYQPWLLLPLLLVIFPGLTSLGILATFPWWPTLLKQLERGITTASAFPMWGEVVGKLSIKSVLLVPVKFLIGRVSIDNNTIFAFAILLPSVIVFYSIVSILKQKDKHYRILQAWLFAPFIIAIFISIKIPIFSYFRFLFVLPAFYLLISLGISKFPNKLKFAAIIILLTTNIISSGTYLFNSRFHREDWRSVEGFINQFEIQQSLVIFPNLAQAAGFDYYNQSNVSTQDKQNLDLTNKPKNVFLVRYVSEIFDPEESITQQLKEDNYSRINELRFRGILVWHFSRIK